MANTQLTSTKSEFFHLIRWVSSIMVVLGHTLMVDRYIWGERAISSWYRYIATNHHAAVMFFFILSGYLISYVSKKYLPKDIESIKSYYYDRWSRIYSVLIPVLLLTFILDRIGLLYFNSIYSNQLIFPQENSGFRFFINLFSLQGTWGKNIQFGSNPALWSIGYEFTFYLIFSLYIFTGKHFYKSPLFWGGLLFFFVIRGPLIMLYFLIWLMGVLSHRLNIIYKIKIKTTTKLLIIAFIAFLNHILERKNIFNFPQYLNDFLFCIPISFLLFFEYEGLFLNKLNKKFKSLNFTLANFSYTLYGTHLPVIFIIYAFIYNSRISMFHNSASLSLITVFICLIFAFFFSKVSENMRLKYREIVAKIVTLSMRKFTYNKLADEINKQN